MRRYLVVIVMCAFGTAAGAQARPEQWTRPGDTVKVWAEVPSLRGAPAITQRFTSDTIYFTVRSAYSPSWLATPVAQSRITRIDIRDVPRRSGRRTLLGIAGGMIVGGAVVGSLVFYTHDIPPCGQPDPNWCEADEFPPELDRAIYTILGSAGGALVGGIVGGRIGSRPVVMWKRVFP